MHKDPVLQNDEGMHVYCQGCKGHTTITPGIEPGTGAMMGTGIYLCNVVIQPGAQAFIPVARVLVRCTGCTQEIPQVDIDRLRRLVTL